MYKITQTLLHKQTCCNFISTLCHQTNICPMTATHHMSYYVYHYLIPVIHHSPASPSMPSLLGLHFIIVLSIRVWCFFARIRFQMIIKFSSLKQQLYCMKCCSLSGYIETRQWQTLCNQKMTSIIIITFTSADLTGELIGRRMVHVKSLSQHLLSNWHIPFDSSFHSNSGASIVY